VRVGLYRLEEATTEEASVTVWDEWGALTRFLESARLAFARESRLWHSLEIRDRESVTITAPRGELDPYQVRLEQHLDAVDDEVTLLASVLIHSYALAEATACDMLGIDSRVAGGIEKWGHRLLQANGRSWTDVLDGEPGAVEVAVVRNAFAHGGRAITAKDAERLQKAGSPPRNPGDQLSLTYDELIRFRRRLRGLMRYGGADPNLARRA
jgi:hypothetical protein